MNRPRIIGKPQRPQPTLFDEMVRVTVRSDGEETSHVEWASPGKVDYITTRYSREKYDAGATDMKVERTGAQKHTRRAS